MQRPVGQMNLLVEAKGRLVGMSTRPYAKRGRRHIQTGVR